MAKKGVWLVLICTMLTVGAGLISLPAYALESTHYRFDESVLGSGGSVQSGSNNYQSRSSAGDLGVGASTSSNYQVAAGSITPKDPNLSFTVNSGGGSFGDLSPATASMATSTFSVTNYTSYGYVVQIVGNTPSSSGHVLPGMTATGPSITGTEQFGINLVANTSPRTIGANPDNGGFGFGQASTNYKNPNQYRYVSGETIVTAPKSSGTTNYTITYLANVAALTPGGKYSTNQTLIVTGTY